jgi:integrase
MPQANLTARNVYSAAELPPPEKGRVEYIDRKTPGLALRVTSTNHRSWNVLYRFKGMPRRFTLGELTDKHGLQWARDEAENQVFRPIAMGIDPASAKSCARKAESFKQMAELYIEEHAKARKRSWKADHNIIHKDLIPAFGSRKAPDISRREVKSLLRDIVKRGAPIQANRTLEVARKLFNWAIGEEIVEHNPCDHIEKPSPERRRERILTADEIKRIWTALPSLNASSSRAYRLLFMLGVRKGEVLGMERPEIDGEWWTIPAERSKNRRPHRVWLSAETQKIIAECLEATKGRKIFPGAGRTGLTFTIYDAHADLLKASDTGDWTIHDIRRTVASGLGSLGFSRFIIGRILNHADREVTAVYDRHTYDNEKRQALEAWQRRLDEIVTGKAQDGNVVAFQGRGA